MESKAVKYYSEANQYYKMKKYREYLQNIESYLKEGKDKPVGLTTVDLFNMAKVYLKTHKTYMAEKLLKKVIELDEKDKYVRLELGKLYVSQGKEKEAEKTLKEVIELDEKNTYARLELGKLYVKQGKEKEAEKLFEYCIKNGNEIYASLELGKLYAEQGKNNESLQMYSSILENIDFEQYNARNSLKHVLKHTKNDKNKEIHGVYTLEIEEMLEKLKQGKAKKAIGYMTDIYCIEAEECGYEGGNKGDGHQLDYITLVTFPNSEQIITMFPSDNIAKGEEETVGETINNIAERLEQEYNKMPLAEKYKLKQEAEKERNKYIEKEER